MKKCVFCKIVSGELPCYKIYEDEYCLAILDASNDVYGHTLVIPKGHHESVLTCDVTNLGRMMDVCKKVGTHYVRDCGFDGFNIMCNTGKAAEQSVPHIHFHIIPRKAGDRKSIYNVVANCKTDLGDVCNQLKFEDEEKTPIDDESCIVIYTDGACSGNPGPGGWASILSYKGKQKILSGGELSTTNNRMELMGVLMALKSVKQNIKIQVYSDSAYVVNAFNQHWIDGWQKNKWKNSEKNDVSNKELWQSILAAMKKRDVEFIKVKGHSDNEYNNRCDAIARNEILKLKNTQQ